MNLEKICSVLFVLAMLTCSLPLTEPKNPTLDPAASGSWKQSTDSDFNGGTFIGGNTTVNGTSASASVVLRKDPLWKEVKPVLSLPTPEGRAFHAVSFDERSNALVVFGGSSSYLPANDTWVYDSSGNSWTNRTSANSPLGRYGHAMVYVPTAGVTVMFGGFSIINDAAMNDTWTYDVSSNVWFNRTRVHSPPARGYHAVAYDSYRNVVVLFGGATAPGGGILFNDTWEYNPANGTWKGPILTTRAPPARTEHGMAYDSKEREIYLYGGANATSNLADTWIYDGTRWLGLSLMTSPPKRFGHAMCYDTTAAKTVVFGGNDGNTLGDLWYYDTGTRNWSLASAPLNSPPAIDKCKMVYDTVHSVCLMFGGLLKNFTDERDVWSLGVSGWAWNDNSVRPSGGQGRILLERTAARTLACVEPGGVSTYDTESNVWSRVANVSINRDSASAVYSPSGDSIIMFGGRSSTVLFNDTFSFNFTGRAWVMQNIAHSPPRRSNHAMALDVKQNIAVLFGGIGESGNLCDTWIYDVAQKKWTEVTSGPIPPPRYDHSMVYIPKTDKILLFGGTGNSEPLNDTWMFNTTTMNWAPVVSPSAPSKRAGPAMAFDPTGKRVLLFGGKILGMSTCANDLWAYDATAGTWRIINVTLPIQPRWKAAFASCSWKGSVALGYGEGPAAAPLGDVWVYPAYRAGGTFVSSKWDTGMSVYGESGAVMRNPGLNYGKVWWNGTGGFGSLQLQLRTASTKDGLNTSQWYGPTGPSDFYVVPGTDINPIHKNVNGRWIQYRLVVNTSNYGTTPELKDITITYYGDTVVPEYCPAAIVPLALIVLAIAVALAGLRKKP